MKSNFKNSIKSECKLDWELRVNYGWIHGKLRVRRVVFQIARCLGHPVFGGGGLEGSCSMATAHMCAVCSLKDDGEVLDLQFTQFHLVPGGQCYFCILREEVTGHCWKWMPHFDVALQRRCAQLVSSGLRGPVAKPTAGVPVCGAADRWRRHADRWGSAGIWNHGRRKKNMNHIQVLQISKINTFLKICKVF